MERTHAMLAALTLTLVAASPFAVPTAAASYDKCEWHHPPGPQNGPPDPVPWTIVEQFVNYGLYDACLVEGRVLEAAFNEVSCVSYTHSVCLP